MAFVKLFSSITESTIWGEPYALRIVWVTMLAMADRDGVVGSSIPGLARRANVTLEEAQAAVSAFTSPDLFSRTPDDEGRRIETIAGGWRLINYYKYREMQSPEEVREKARLRKQRQRSKQEQSVTSVTKRDSHGSHAIAEAEAEAESGIQGTETLPVKKRSKKKVREAALEFVSAAQAAAFAEFWSNFWLKKDKDSAQMAYIAAVLTQNQHKAVMAGVEAQKAEQLETEPRFRLRGGPWIRGSRWNDEVVRDFRAMSAAERLIASL